DVSRSNAQTSLPTRRWSRFVHATPHESAAGSQACIIGVLPGEGIGPGVIDATLLVLKAVESCSPEAPFAIPAGGPIGDQAVRESGRALSGEVRGFCRDIFANGGAILAGAGGDRFVYEMRREFDLYCKISPLITRRELAHAGCLKPDHAADVDILVVRENLG